MKKLLSFFAVTICLAFLIPAPASAFLKNWYLDPTGAASGTGDVLIGELLDTVGTTWIDNTIGSGNTGTFEEWGAFESSGHDGLGSTIGYTDADSNKFGGELTALFYGTGNVDLNSGTIDFTDGWLDIYTHDTADFGSNTDGGTDARGNPITYGANNGTLIASFDVLAGGGGSVDVTGSEFAGAPNGEITTNLVATYINPGYWTMPDGVTDFSDLPIVSWILGYGTTNASFVDIDPDNPGLMSTAVNELVVEFASSTFVGTPPDDFIISGNGQFRVDVVPEPTSILLFGFGLLGCAAISRRKNKG